MCASYTQLALIAGTTSRASHTQHFSAATVLHLNAEHAASHHLRTRCQTEPSLRASTATAGPGMHMHGLGPLVACKRAFPRGLPQCDPE
jgi:hypothetical protein